MDALQRVGFEFSRCNGPRLQFTLLRKKLQKTMLNLDLGKIVVNRVIVTGGSGFIGSNLCESLLNRGCEVVCVDNFYTGRKINLDSLLKNPRFDLIRHDIIFPLYLEADRIFNMACPASPAQYQQNPIRTMKTNVCGAINMLALAKRIEARILQASTSEVYGDPEVHPQHEDYWGRVNPIGLRACYDEGKRCAETLFFDYWRQHRVEIKVARIFNTYGPRMRSDDGRVVSNFIVQALRGEPLTIFGDGRQTRSFCYVDDTVDGLLRLMDSVESITGPINIGNPVECTILDLAQLIIDLTASRSRILHRPLPVDDPRQRRPDIERARSLLGWAPVTSLREGLIATIAWFDSNLSAAR